MGRFFKVFLGVTAPLSGGYNLNSRVPAMTSQAALSNSLASASVAKRLAELRAAWSCPISSRADAKLAPCMARPNLFSGD